MELGTAKAGFYADHPQRAEYVLTEKGRTLGPLLKMLLQWGTKHTQAPGG
jgi:DNA-binding HxlR family transcriptional regulator